MELTECISPPYIVTMPDIYKEIEGILGRKGWLSKVLPNFEFRPSQLEMALLIARALEEERPVLIEAGTGTGKTLGYLIPLILSGKKAIVSTATRNLQEQIYFKDIPLLADHPLLGTKNSMGGPNVLMMKGRSNYLCLYKYHQSYDQASLQFHKQEADDLERWLTTTRFGDLSELQWLEEESPLRDLLSSSSEQCLGGLCPYYEDCFLTRLRAEAERANLVIVNHHLFFADLKVRQTGFGEVLPRVQAAVFDEAHEVEEIALTYFGHSIGSRQLEELASDLEKALVPELISRGEERELKKVSAGLRVAAQGFREWFEAMDEKGRLDQKMLEQFRRTAAHQILKALAKAEKSLDEATDISPAMPGLKARAAELHSITQEVTKARSEWLNWYEKKKRSVTIHVSPLEIGESLKEALYSRVKCVAFTSATISTNGNFTYIQKRLGLDEHCLKGLYPSHFDFKEQTLLYVPKDLPLPGEPHFAASAAVRIKELLLASSGRALVLFTSHNNLDKVYDLVKDGIPFKAFRQGQAPRSTVLRWFVEDVHSVLLATGSFWQGVDVPGEALSCLIIDKLPFASPGDPLVAARIESIRTRGGNPFMEYQVPSAIIALRQGLGRLIRKRSDRGVMAVLDKRLVGSRYGRLFLDSLPPIPMTHNLDDVRGFFKSS